MAFLACGVARTNGEAVQALAAITAGDASISIQFRGSPPDLGQSALLEWIERSAAIVRAYYGEFPIKAVTVWVTTVESDRMGAGRTFGLPHARIEVNVGQHISREALQDDWVLVHEMIHLALPEVADEQNWLAEGIATYVEGVARTQAGNMREADLWAEYVEAMPRGLPQADDQGLDRTHTWGRTYWGGALYCLMADVRIREQTHNRRGLQEALRAVARVGAGMATRWPAERIFAAGDAATGTTVLTDLYAEMKDKPAAPDLDALWAELGIRIAGGVVRFDDSARLAAVRRAITHALPAGESHKT
jgi:predicted metalloprotease with PDZ domain